MKSKLFVRDLPTLNTEKVRSSLNEGKQKELEELRDNMKNMTESILQMTQEIKDMKKFMLSED